MKGRPVRAATINNAPAPTLHIALVKPAKYLAYNIMLLLDRRICDAAVTKTLSLIAPSSGRG